MHKQRERLTYWKKYADPELYNKCMRMGLNKRAGRYICLEVNFYYRIPRTLSMRKTKKIYTNLSNKGVSLSDIVNKQMQEAIDDYDYNANEITSKMDSI